MEETKSNPVKEHGNKKRNQKKKRMLKNTHNKKDLKIAIPKHNKILAAQIIMDVSIFTSLNNESHNRKCQRRMKRSQWLIIMMKSWISILTLPI